MHIIVIAWLYVILMMAFASATPVTGAVLFIGAGLGPVLLLAWLLRRRARGRTSMPEQDMHQRDAGHAESDK